MIRAETHNRIRKVDGSWMYEPKLFGIRDKINLSQEIKNLNNMVSHGQYRKYDIIPCGHCTGCYLEYARDKAVQLSLENMNPEYQENEKWFITLTYKDECIPYHTYRDEESKTDYTGISLKIEDMQNFWKRVRQYVKRKCKRDIKVRYLCCGEYGSETYRPHYHAIVFGLPLEEAKLEKIDNNHQGDPIWTHPDLQKLWSKYDENGKFVTKMGNVQIGKVTFQSISYVARYTLKKANKSYEPWWYYAQGKKLEFICQSDDLGLWYYNTHKDEIYQRDLVPVKDKSGRFQKPPRSFDRRFKAENPEEMEKVLKRRKKLMLNNILSQEMQTDMDYDEILNSKEISINEFKNIRGDQ